MKNKKNKIKIVYMMQFRFQILTATDSCLYIQELLGYMWVQVYFVLQVNLPPLMFYTQTQTSDAAKAYSTMTISLLCWVT